MSFRNATMVEYEGEPAGCLIGYEIAARPEPVPPDWVLLTKHF